MRVQIIKRREGAWWEHHMGESFKVKLTAEYPGHYRLLERIPGEPDAFLISKSDCIPLESSDTQVTNKMLSPILEKEY